MKSSIIGIVSLLALAVSSCTSYQEKDVPVGFSVNREELSFPQNGESQSVTVASGTKWDVTSMPSWISIRSISQSGQSPYEWTVDFYSTSNEEYNREGTIVFKSQNGSSEVTVTQEGKKGRYVAVESVNLSKTELTMTVGESVTLTYGIIPSDASIKDVSWESGATTVATVSQSGQIDAISEGKTTITVKTKDGEKTASCTVTVKPVAVSSVTLDKETLSLKIGESYSLIATVLPESAANKKVSWSSSNKSVATVDETGKVTAVGVGSAKITVTTNDGGKTATCSVVVSPISVTGVSLNKSSLSLTIGGTEQLIATVVPTNATNKNVTWSSSNSNVAAVDSNGNVSAIKVGTAIITATTEDGGKKATCSVTVNPVSVTGVSLNQTNLTMAIGDTQTLAATVTPSNATDKSVSWSSSNTSVATVSSSGVVTAKSAGAATITVTTNDGGKKATCSVTVKAQTIAVTGVSLNKTSLSMTVGDTQTLTATVTPSNATDKSVTWSSSNTSVATVSSSGVVTAKAAGSATITVTTNDGGKKATCSVTVQAQKIAVTGVSLNKTSLSMTVGETQTLMATVTPSNATDKSVAWSSSNTSVATVSSSGVVTAKSMGSATVTVKTNVGGKTALCAVTVESPPLTNNVIYYSSSDGNIISLNNSNDFGASIISNEYTSGRGILIFDGAVTSIGGAFLGCLSLSSIVIPESVTSIGESPFAGCISLTAIKVDSGNRVYDSRNNCNAIIETKSNTLIAGCQNTIIPNSVTSIDDLAFGSCEYLSSIVIPNSVSRIGTSAFVGCVSLTSIVIPESVICIEDGAFTNCSRMSAIRVDSGNSVYDSRNNCNAIIETKSNTLLFGCNSTVIPNSVKTIGDGAFQGCWFLHSIVIPNSVTSIHEWAFESCHELSSIEIPDSVTYLGDCVFWNCPNMKSIAVMATIPPILGEKVFHYGNDCPIYVPKSSINAYKVAQGWSEYADRIQALN